MQNLIPRCIASALNRAMVFVEDKYGPFGPR